MNEDERKVIQELHELRRKLPAIDSGVVELHSKLQEIILDTEERLEVVFERYRVAQPPSIEGDSGQ